MTVEGARAGSAPRREGAWLHAPRRRTLLFVGFVLLLLDVGRSLYARYGYEQPTGIWQPQPSELTNVMWPPGSDLAPGTPPGRRIFVERCAVCHGTNGQGTGPASPSMVLRPRDFTSGHYKYKTTPASAPPSDEDLIRTVTRGLHASAMPYWSDVLSDGEIREVVNYIKSLAPAVQGTDALPITVSTRVPPTPESVARGRVIFENAGCMACHGEAGRGGNVMQEVEGARHDVVVRDLTAPWTFRGGSDPEQVWLRLTTGLMPSPMPSFADTLSDDERWDVTNYVASIARTAPWEPGGRLEGPGSDPDLMKRGHYLAHTENCGLCHTPTNITGAYRGNDRWLSGGMWTRANPYGVYLTRNLTSDLETGIGGWTEQQLATAIRTGRTPERLLNPFVMPWPLFYNLTEEDALALSRYLKTLPAVRNAVPAPLRYGYVESVLRKLRHLPVGLPKVLEYEVYAFGREGGGIPRDIPQTVLIVLQWLVLGIGLLVFVLAGPREQRYPRRPGTWMGIGLVVVGIAITFVIYQLPMLRMMPPATISKGSTGKFYKPTDAQMRSPEHAALVRRGQYLYRVIACGNCHGPDGAGGGKISWGGSQNPDGTWNGSGTYWTANITPDRETGIGSWSDAQIARGIRSGMTDKGRQVHWQGMIWDHLGNLDEEDVRALIEYLKTLPPVKKAIPSPRPPSADSCRLATVWLKKTNFSDGCQ